MHDRSISRNGIWHYPIKNAEFNAVVFIKKISFYQNLSFQKCNKFSTFFFYKTQFFSQIGLNDFFSILNINVPFATYIYILHQNGKNFFCHLTYIHISFFWTLFQTRALQTRHALVRCNYRRNGDFACTLEKKFFYTSARMRANVRLRTMY